jgi:cell division inhibitor SepF
MNWLKRALGLEEQKEQEWSEERPPAGALPAPKAASSAKSGLSIVLAEPQSFEDGKRIADDLKAMKPVVVNLENLEHEVARRCIDFLSGTIYALSGSVEKIAESVFLFAPASVGVEEGRKKSWEGSKPDAFDAFLSQI